MKTIRCVFCDGKGKDPFGIMSWLANCPVCLGRGVVQVPSLHVPCAHCKGSGAIKKFTCGVCCGRGMIPAPIGSTKVCQDCLGTGDDNSASAMPCLTCRGRGWDAAK